MKRISFAAALVAAGSFMGGCATEHTRHADSRNDMQGGMIYDDNTDTYLDPNIYIDSRNVQEASAPRSNGFSQGQYWSDEPEPNRDVYAIPRNTDDLDDTRDLNRSEELKRSNERLNELDRNNDGIDDADRQYRDFEQEEVE